MLTEIPRPLYDEVISKMIEVMVQRKKDRLDGQCLVADPASCNF